MGQRRERFYTFRPDPMCRFQETGFMFQCEAFSGEFNENVETEYFRSVTNFNVLIVPVKLG